MPTSDNGSPTSPTERIALARQPIVDAQRQVVAYTVFQRTQPTAAAAPDRVPFVLQALAGSGAALPVSKSDLFVPTPHHALDGPHWEFIDPASTVVEVSLVPGHAPAAIAEIAGALQRLQLKGFRMAFTHGVIAPVYKTWHPFAQFVHITPAAATQANLPALIAAVRSRTGATPVAAAIDTAEAFESFKTLGVERFQGIWCSTPEPVQPGVLSPGQTTALRLFNMLRNEAPLDAVEQTLKKDAALGLSLLRIINSAAMGLRQPVTSLRQAMQWMGYQKLARWSAMLMTFAGQGKHSLLGSSSVVRGRMMELLFQSHGSDDEAGAAFLVGLLSPLDSMLGVPMAELLERLELDPEVAAALLHRSGRFGPLLALVVACESEDERAFAHAFERLSYSNHQINMAHLEALAWASNLQ